MIPCGWPLSFWPLSGLLDYAMIRTCPSTWQTLLPIVKCVGNDVFKWKMMTLNVLGSTQIDKFFVKFVKPIWRNILGKCMMTSIKWEWKLGGWKTCTELMVLQFFWTLLYLLLIQKNYHQTEMDQITWYVKIG